MPVLTSFKFHIVKLLGTLLVIHAFSCYLFDYPSEGDEIINGGELLVGCVLMYIDMKKAVEELWQSVLNRFFKK